MMGKWLYIFLGALLFQVLGAEYFIAGVDATLRGLAGAKNRKSPTYFYEYTFEGFSLWKEMMGYGDWKGRYLNSFSRRPFVTLNPNPVSPTT